MAIRAFTCLPHSQGQAEVDSVRREISLNLGSAKRRSLTPVAGGMGRAVGTVVEAIAGPPVERYLDMVKRLAYAATYRDSSLEEC